MIKNEEMTNKMNESHHYKFGIFGCLPSLRERNRHDERIVYGRGW